MTLGILATKVLNEEWLNKRAYLNQELGFGLRCCACKEQVEIIRSLLYHSIANCL